MSKRWRIALLHQGFVPRYRERFYTLLNAQDDNEYVVFHGPAPKRTGHAAAPGPFRFPNVFRRNIEMRVGCRSLIYQPVVWDILTGGFDAVVVGHEFKMLANHLVMAAFKAMGKPVLFWGHGYHRDSAHWLARSASGALARFADGYLVYTEGGAERLHAVGVAPEDIFVIHNTIDLAEQIAAHGRFKEADTGGLRRDLGLRPEAKTLLYVGRLYARKRCQDLIEMVRRLNGDPGVGPFDLAIVGDGPDYEGLRASASALNNVRFFGEIHEPEQIGRLMRVSVAMVNPGSAGLAVNHSFAHGVPVITRDGMLHSPEFEYIRDGENGLIAVGPIEAFVSAVRRVLNEPELAAQLAEGALATRQRLGLDRMVESFSEGVMTTIGRKGRKSLRASERHGAVDADASKEDADKVLTS